MKKDLNKLIGIPFKLGGDDFNGCDCKGICYLYYKYVHGKKYPHDDGGKLLKRDVKKDTERIISFVKNFCKKIEFNDLKEGDLVIVKADNSVGALGVCIDDKRVLHTTIVMGSMLTKLNRIKNKFIAGFRPNDKENI
jgi:cell wall-associated NlpC family hydrolase